MKRRLSCLRTAALLTLSNIREHTQMGKMAALSATAKGTDSLHHFCPHITTTTVTWSQFPGTRSTTVPLLKRGKWYCQQAGLRAAMVAPVHITRVYSFICIYILQHESPQITTGLGRYISSSGVDPSFQMYIYIYEQHLAQCIKAGIQCHSGYTNVELQVVPHSF